MVERIRTNLPTIDGWKLERNKNQKYSFLRDTERHVEGSNLVINRLELIKRNI